MIYLNVQFAKKIAMGSCVDVIEIDAASHTGVDYMRQLIDQVQFLPVEAAYKVFIIDEVHMLSTGAFNALLKTLEEPPKQVVFILATTEFKNSGNDSVTISNAAFSIIRCSI